MRRFAASSVPAAAKSSNALSVTWIRWSRMNGAPSRAPCSADLMAHSHSSTAQPSKPVLRKFREYAAEIHLAVAERAEPARAFHPGLIAAIDALTRGRIELGVLDVERADALVVEVDEAEIVELLQHEMTRVVEDLAAPMVADARQEHLEAGAVVQVLAGMDLEAHINTRGVERIEDRLPACGERVERGLDQAGRTLRPGIDIGPGERAGERRMRRQAETRGGTRRLHQLPDRPRLPRRWVASHGSRGETVEGFVIGRMHRDKLALEVR